MTGGTSIVMFTELLAGHEPLAKGLLAYSQSEDPTSPYYEDQTQRLSKNEWITLAVDAGLGRRRRDRPDGSAEVAADQGSGTGGDRAAPD